MSYQLSDSRTVYPASALESLTGAPVGYLSSLDARLAPVVTETPRGLLTAFDGVREVAWKYVGVDERAEAHPALGHYMALNYAEANAARRDVLASLTEAGFDADAPLSDAALRALLGPSLYRLRSRVFPGAARSFYTAEAVAGVAATYARTAADLDREAERNRLARERRGLGKSNRTDDALVCEFDQIDAR